jgi:hypothetical protein
LGFRGAFGAAGFGLAGGLFFPVPTTGLPVVAVNRSRILVVGVFEAVVTIAGRYFGVQQ